ncbi:CoA transferase [Alteromonas sp. D210916BOD_24]|uniref:CaiB/BaiF CoA transferase family protein n=1 Tax=Alteromonas sp. D210916BOD_24 TaxID=3157618 RepID=UPI00399C63F8
MNKPLSGVTVIDLTHMLSGPYCGMILADLGAETVKVEPLQGEGTRKLLATDPENSLDGMGAYFITLNRNKKSVCIDLKSEEGLQVFYELVKQADVVVNNFGAGVPSRLKIDYEHLRKVNPKIITCSITGFGSNGPNYKRPAFDQVAQATGGGMSITGTDPEHPVRAGIPIGDLGGGMFAVMGIQAALIERANSGVGQDVDISMLDCQISLLNYMATMYFLSNKDPFPIGNSHFVHVPYNTYKTADGFIVIAVITDNFWQNLKAVVQIASLDIPEFDTQPGRWAKKDMIDETLNTVLQSQTSEYWLSRLEAARIPCAPVNTFSQALNDEQVKHRKMVVELTSGEGNKTKGPGNPIKFSRTTDEVFSPAPKLGEHTQEILTGVVGLSPQELSRLYDLKVVG